MPCNRKPVVPECALEVILGEKRTVVGLVGFVRKDRNGAPPAEVAERVRRREPGCATAHDRHGSERDVDLAEPWSGLRLGRLYREAIPFNNDSIFLQGVESWRRRRLAGRKVEAGMVPRAADDPVGEDPLVQRAGEMRAVCAVGL